MALRLSLSESQTLFALRAVLAQLVPSTVPIVQAQANRVPTPKAPTYIVLNVGTRQGLATTYHDYADALFTAAIAGTLMTVSAVEYGALAIERQVFGPLVASVTPGTVITALGTGSGGVGTYSVSPSQTVASQLLAAGVLAIAQDTMVLIDIDVHGPDSSDLVQIIATTFQDQLAVDLFEDTDLDVTPLYIETPHEVPFLNDQQQIEYRWTMTSALQCKPSFTWPQQFAQSLRQGLINVDASYPA